MKELKKLAIVLRGLDLYAQIEKKGTVDEFLCVRDNNHGVSYEWQIFGRIATI